MNSIDDKLLRYFEGELIGKEKEDFEKLLQSDESLKQKLTDFQKISNAFALYNELEAENMYPASEFVFEPIKRKKETLFSRLFPTPAYIYSTAGTLAVFLIIIMALSYYKNSESYDINKITSELKEAELSEAIETYAKNYYSTEASTEAINDSAIGNYYLDEVIKNTDEISAYITSNSGFSGYSSSLIKDISEEDADRIYNELLNKKIL